uniref:Mechanosensitive ion channel MscS domain-containing protein n=1 Tax=Mucochytrium quahogii TaxID=96639 RepID=A0A7S2RET0_9STRA|mmetsp:Transcript_1507/g.2244  ORF Transcript_1507/g.2244 Transcript_1507/m.2244 type:complete len:730 (+) Transcript_1507:471-2660(+)
MKMQEPSGAGEQLDGSGPPPKFSRGLSRRQKQETSMMDLAGLGLEKPSLMQVDEEPSAVDETKIRVSDVGDDDLGAKLTIEPLVADPPESGHSRRRSKGRSRFGIESKRSNAAYSTVQDDEVYSCKENMCFFCTTSILPYMFNIIALLLGLVFLFVAVYFVLKEDYAHSNIWFVVAIVFVSCPVTSILLWGFAYLLSLASVNEAASKIYYYFIGVKPILWRVVTAAFWLGGVIGFFPDSSHSGSPWFQVRNLIVLWMSGCGMHAVGIMFRMNFTQSFATKSYFNRIMQSLQVEYCLVSMLGFQPTPLFVYLLKNGMRYDEDTIGPMLLQRLVLYVHEHRVDGTTLPTGFRHVVPFSEADQNYQKRFSKRLFAHIYYLCSKIELYGGAENIKKVDPNRTFRKNVNTSGSSDIISINRGDDSCSSGSNLLSVGSRKRKISKEDFVELFRKVFEKAHVDAGQMWEELAKDEGVTELSERRFQEGIVQLFLERGKISSTIRSTTAVLQSLDVYVIVFSSIFAIFIALWIYQVSIVQVVVPLSSLFVGFAFIFGESMKNSFQSIIFIFVIRPYEVSDMVMINDERYEVMAINLLAVQLRRWDNVISMMEHRQLWATQIFNLSKSGKFGFVQKIDIDISCVTEEFLEAMRKDIKEYLRKHPDRFTGEFNFQARDFVSPLKIRCSNFVEQCYNSSDLGRSNLSRSAYLTEVCRMLERRKVKYSAALSGELFSSNPM